MIEMNDEARSLQVTRHFELINYSEFGSSVNGVRYACDATPRRAAPDAAAARAAALQAAVRHRLPRPHRYARRVLLVVLCSSRRVNIQRSIVVVYCLLKHGPTF